MGAPTILDGSASLMIALTTRLPTCFLFVVAVPMVSSRRWDHKLCGLVLLMLRQGSCCPASCSERRSEKWERHQWYDDDACAAPFNALFAARQVRDFL